METIYNLKVDHYKQYARKEDSLEKDRLSQEAFSVGATISADTKIPVLEPQFTQTEILLGTNKKTTIALFPTPPYGAERRSNSIYGAPSLGPSERRDQAIEKISQIETGAPPEEKEETLREGAAIRSAIEQTLDEDEEVDFTVTRIMQYLR